MATVEKKKDIMKEWGIAATLTIHGGADMSPEGAKAIAKWITKQRKYFLKDRKNFSKKNTLHYWYKKPKVKK